MRLVNLIPKIIIIVLASVFAFLVGSIVPENQFDPYTLEMDSTWSKVAESQEYIVDINNDSLPEKVLHSKINKSGQSLELTYNNKLTVIGIFDNNDFFVSRYLKFADVNHDGINEFLFIAVNNHIASLYIFEFEFSTHALSPKPKITQIDFDTILYYNNHPDVINYDILTHNSDIYFDLQAGYSIQPRNIYKYNFQTKKLIKTARNSLVNKKSELLAFDNQDYILAKNVVVAGNTFSHKQAEKYRNSKNPDSAQLYEHIKNKLYQYGDFSSYILLYNNHLDFAFPPIEFYGWTNTVLSEFLWIDSIPYILSLTNTQSDDHTSKKLTLCNLQGAIVQQASISNNYTNLFVDGDEIALTYDINLDIFSSELERRKKIDGISYASGFYDLSDNSRNEFIAFKKNRLIIFSDNFSRKTSFTIAQEFAPYPENNRIEILKKEGKSYFLYNTRLFYYLFSYSHNRFAFLKYPFYAALFFFWYGLLFVLLRVNSKRLEKEKQQLEKTVSERTQQLQHKNQELALQKEEIEAQAEKIGEQFKHLEKLDLFKESLTHALVHDLKNPLSQILLGAGNQEVNYPARKMMRLITNMLDVEKYENTEFSLNKQVHSLRSLLTEVKIGQEMSMREKNLKLRFLFDDFLVLADKEVMVRVFDNLLANAIRFSPQNQNIDVIAELKDDHTIHIAMRNYGEPIPEEALPYIFDKYRHFGKTDSSSTRSTGLGLAFCKMAVEAHGGKIGAWSKPGEGCTFWFTVPYTSKAGEIVEIETVAQDANTDLQFSETDFEVLKEVVKQLKGFKIYEISRFHETLDPLKETTGNAVNEWVSQLFSTIYVQNMDEFNRLINLAENGQT